tara:strand:+ start:139 stop:342 length:204 start_codon:yes stop_codon:yes gene_type:complete
MKKMQWEDLDFDPMRDGYWPTQEQIKQRIKEKSKQTKKVALVIWMTTVLAIAFLLFIIWIMIGGYNG